MPKAAIVTEKLTRKYDQRAVVNSLDLEVPENTVFGFLGPNGAGKSTTMKMLTGQIKPTSGKAWVAGVEVSQKSLETKQQIGYLTEMPNFYNWMRGQEMLEFVGELFGLSPADRRARAKELLKLVDLDKAANQKIGGYSGGMRQRLGIAQALVNRPRVVFLDEPVSALDPIGRRDVLKLLDEIRQEATVFMSSHVLADVDRVCEYVAILNQGNLIAAGRTTELKERYAQPAIEIELEGGPAASQQLAYLLQGESWVKKIVPQYNGRLRVELAGENRVHEAGQRLPRLVAENNLTLLTFQTAVPNLEDVFMQLVGKVENPLPSPISANQKEVTLK